MNLWTCRLCMLSLHYGLLLSTFQRCGCVRVYAVSCEMREKCLDYKLWMTFADGRDFDAY